MKRRLALLLYRRALKLEPQIGLAIHLEMQAAIHSAAHNAQIALLQHQYQVSRIAHSN